MDVLLSRPRLHQVSRHHHPLSPGVLAAVEAAHFVGERRRELDPHLSGAGGERLGEAACEGLQLGTELHRGSLRHVTGRYRNVRDVQSGRVADDRAALRFYLRGGGGGG